MPKCNLLYRGAGRGVFCKGYICDKEKVCHVFNVFDVY